MNHAENDTALAIIKGGAAHSDIGIPLSRAARDLNDAVWISGKRSDFPAAGVMLNGKVFAFVEGMRHVTLCLSATHAQALSKLGGVRHPDFASGHWINVTPSDQAIDLPAWLHKAYNAAKQ